MLRTDGVKELSLNLFNTEKKIIGDKRLLCHRRDEIIFSHHDGWLFTVAL
jgi:hypothetical protein